MIPKMYTKKEAAEILRISIPTIDRLILDGRLNSTKIGKRRLFTEDHINELIKNGEV